MRIVGGSFKGRRFSPPAKNWPTRPTTDFAKEALYNILVNRIDFEETKVLDLFGGSGNHCYETISRGATDVTYVDKHYHCTQFVKKIAQELDIEDHIKIIKNDVFKFIRSCSDTFDFIFCDPPYDLSNLSDIPDLIFENTLLKSDGILVLEHDQHNDFKDHLCFQEERKYGGTIFSFFSQSK